MSNELWNPGHHRTGIPIVALANGEIKNRAFKVGNIHPLTNDMLSSFGIPCMADKLKVTTDKEEAESDIRLGLSHEPAVVRKIRPVVYTIDKALSKARAFVGAMNDLGVEKFPFYIAFNDAIWYGRNIYNKRNGNLKEILTDLEAAPEDTVMFSNTGTVVVPPDPADLTAWEFYYSTLQVGEFRKTMLDRYVQIATTKENEKIAMGLKSIQAIREGIIKPKNGLIQLRFFRLYGGGMFEPKSIIGTIRRPEDMVFCSQISSDSANNPLIVNGSLGTVPISDIISLSLSN